MLKYESFVVSLQKTRSSNQRNTKKLKGILNSRPFLSVGKGNNSGELVKAYAKNSREEIITLNVKKRKLS